MQRGLYPLMASVLMLSYVSPSFAKFEHLEDRQQDISELHQREIGQADDIAKIREAMQENNILLKGIIIEMRKQTELMDAIIAEQKNQGIDISRQTELLEQTTNTKPTE